MSNKESNKEDFELFIDQMLGNAVMEFKSTEQYRLIQEKLERMDGDCDTILTKDDKAFATQCFELIMDANGQEELYVYRKGLLDCVKLLKWLEVLA